MRSRWSSVIFALAEGEVVCFCGTIFAASEVAALVALSELWPHPVIRTAVAAATERAPTAFRVREREEALFVRRGSSLMHA